MGQRKGRGGGFEESQSPSYEQKEKKNKTARESRTKSKKGAKEKTISHIHDWQQLTLGGDYYCSKCGGYL
jgi:hypothetical protein